MQAGAFSAPRCGGSEMYIMLNIGGRWLDGVHPFTWLGISRSLSLWSFAKLKWISVSVWQLESRLRTKMNGERVTQAAAAAWCCFTARLYFEHELFYQLVSDARPVHQHWSHSQMWAWSPSRSNDCGCSGKWTGFNSFHKSVQEN